jgi:hypothetical protein
MSGHNLLYSQLILRCRLEAGAVPGAAGWDVDAGPHAAVRATAVTVAPRSTSRRCGADR